MCRHSWHSAGSPGWPFPMLRCYKYIFQIHTYTHPFNGHLSGTTRLSRYQIGKTNLDFTEVRDSEWQWHQLGHMQVSTSPQTDNHASTPPLSFLQAGCPSSRPTNSVKALKARYFSNTEANLSNSTRKRLWLEISNMLIAV